MFKVGDKVRVKNTRTKYYERTGVVKEFPTPDVARVQLTLGGKELPFSVRELERVTPLWL